MLSVLIIISRNSLTRALNICDKPYAILMISLILLLSQIAYCAHGCVQRATRFIISNHYRTRRANRTRYSHGSSKNREFICPT